MTHEYEFQLLIDLCFVRTQIQLQLYIEIYNNIIYNKQIYIYK